MEHYYVIAGDLHLERAQYGLTVRFQDNLKCVEAIIEDVCTNPACKGLWLTGDNFHKKALLPKYQILFNQLQQRVLAAGKEIKAIDGNHDGSDASWLDTMGSTLNADGQVAQVNGFKAAFLSFRSRAELYERIKQLPKDTKALLLHGRLLELMSWASAQAEPDYDFSAKELRELGLEGCTVFMGDIHTYSDFHDPVGNNWFIYSGSTEMTEVSEGNVISERFGGKYDTVKKYIRFYPNRPLGENWEAVDLPNRAFLKRVVESNEDAKEVIQSLNAWVDAHPGGILALHYPDTMREALKSHLVRWEGALLSFFNVPLSEGTTKPLQDMKEVDILAIAEQELTVRQVQVLKRVLNDEPLSKAMTEVLTPEITEQDRQVA